MHASACTHWVPPSRLLLLLLLLLGRQQKYAPAISPVRHDVTCCK